MKFKKNEVESMRGTRKLRRATELLDAETDRYTEATGVLEQMGELNRAGARRDALKRARSGDKRDG